MTLRVSQNALRNSKQPNVPRTDPVPLKYINRLKRKDLFMSFSSDKLYEDFETPSKTVFDIEAIRNSIKNILFTPVGTMPGKPTFGSRLLEVPFSQNDLATRVLVSRIIWEALAENEPRVKVSNVSFTQKGNTFVAKIIFKFKDSSLSGSVSVDLNA